MKPLFLPLLLCLCSAAALAQRNLCSGGAGTGQINLPGGYIAAVGPATDSAHPGECHAFISAADGKSLYDVFGNELALNQISGSDINDDGKPDAVIESHPAPHQCCYGYYILTPSASPILLRELSTSVPLNFEDKLGDGKVEIWTRDFAFDGVEGYPHAESPLPLIFFRLRGKTLYDVSTLFWSDYEKEIDDAKQGISRSDIDELTKVEGDKPKPPQEGDPKAEHLRSVQALVLTVVLDYLYAGRGPEAWKAISDMWPLLDRQRIRQVILERRMHGILSEINRPAPQQAASN